MQSYVTACNVYIVFYRLSFKIIHLAISHVTLHQRFKLMLMYNMSYSMHIAKSSQ